MLQLGATLNLSLKWASNFGFTGDKMAIIALLVGQTSAVPVFSNVWLGPTEMYSDNHQRMSSAIVT